jgi:DNA (cytosine-5)-methyltransferase 1
MEVIGSIYTEVSEKFQRGIFPIARCVKAEKHDLGVVLMNEVKVIGSLESKFESTNRIYDVGGCSPTLSTMQGGGQEPKIFESQIVAMRGRNPDNPSDRSVGRPTEQRLEVNTQRTSNCLTSVQKDNLVIEPQYRIRKLTPRECGRLMAVSDEDISKMEEVNSNSQLYKQFGNSIVVDVMCAMFKNLNIEQK